MFSFDKSNPLHPSAGTFMRAPEASVTGNCASCGKSAKNAANNDDHLKRCGGCKQVAYCDKECQKRHWKEHKVMCGCLASRSSKFKSYMSSPQHQLELHATLSAEITEFVDAHRAMWNYALVEAIVRGKLDSADSYIFLLSHYDPKSTTVAGKLKIYEGRVQNKQQILEFLADIEKTGEQMPENKKAGGMRFCAKAEAAMEHQRQTAEIGKALGKAFMMGLILLMASYVGEDYPTFSLLIPVRGSVVLSQAAMESIQGVPDDAGPMRGTPWLEVLKSSTEAGEVTDFKGRGRVFEDQTKDN